MEKLTIDQFTVFCHNVEETRTLKSEIFTHHCYYFETDEPAPRIIDAGAHIGLATLYCKKIYPDARITAIEPHPENAALLRKNIEANMLRDVTVLEVALANESGVLRQLHADTQFDWHSTASYAAGAWNGAQHTAAISVRTLTLLDLLNEPVDLLKLDIEGAELEVLQVAKSKLHLVKHLICEFHPTMGQQYDSLWRLLQDSGFSTISPTPREYERSSKKLALVEANR